MKALALVFPIIVSVSACESTRVTQSAPAESSAPLRAGPGGFLPTVCLGQDDARAWQRTDPTTIGWEVPETWRGSQCPWSVIMRNGIPIVVAGARARKSATPEFVPEDTSERPGAVQRGRSGVLAGFDGGEWGGSLRWYSVPDAPGHVLLDSNVVALLRTTERFVALTYVGHGSQGRAVEVLDKPGGFEVGEMVDLPHAPSTGAVETGGDILVAAGRTLLRLSRGLQATVLLDNLVRPPVSLAIAERDTVYLGMHGLVVELQMSTEPPTQTWLYPY